MKHTWKRKHYTVTLTIDENHVPTKLTHKRRWIKALKSGKYKQGENMLFNGVEYCCLGVLASLTHHDQLLHGALTLTDRQLRIGTQSLEEKYGIGSQGNIPPTCEVTIRYPKCSKKTHCRDTDNCDKLTMINDFGVSFTIIAQIIDLIWK